MSAAGAPHGYALPLGGHRELKHPTGTKKRSRRIRPSLRLGSWPPSELPHQSGVNAPRDRQGASPPPDSMTSRTPCSASVPRMTSQKSFSALLSHELPATIEHVDDDGAAAFASEPRSPALVAVLPSRDASRPHLFTHQPDVRALDAACRSLESRMGQWTSADLLFGVRRRVARGRSAARCQKPDNDLTLAAVARCNPFGHHHADPLKPTDPFCALGLDGNGVLLAVIPARTMRELERHMRDADSPCCVGIQWVASLWWHYKM